MARTGRPPKIETAHKRAVEEISKLQSQNSQLREQIKEVRADEKKAVDRVRSLELEVDRLATNDECDLSHKQLAFLELANMFFKK